MPFMAMSNIMWVFLDEETRIIKNNIIRKPDAMTPIILYWLKNIYKDHYPRDTATHAIFLLFFTCPL